MNEGSQSTATMLACRSWPDWLVSRLQPPGSSLKLLALSVQHKDRKAEIERHVSQTGDLLEKVPSAPTSHVHHLYFQVDYVDHQFPEDCEIFFFLYDQVRGRQITERFGMPWERRREKSKFHEQENHSAVFTVRVKLGGAAWRPCSVVWLCPSSGPGD